MIDNKWFCEPDDQRECWCFLILKRNNQSVIDGWEMGYGNPSKLTRMIKNKEQTEEKIIYELLHELYRCKRETITILTYRKDDYPILRTRIALRGIREVYLCGMKHICIEKVMEEYFLFDISENISIYELADKLKIAEENRNTVKLLWKLFLTMGPLLPIGVIP